MIFIIFLLLQSSPVSFGHGSQHHRTLQTGGVTVPAWDNGDQYLGEWLGVDLSWQHVASWSQGRGTGLSYYLRATDIFPRWYARQFGWGQWVSPAEPEPAAGEPCSFNPRKLVCVPVGDDFDISTEGDVENCSWDEEDPRLEACQFGLCEDGARTSVNGVFEGGMGFWPYVTGAKGAKWMLPGAVSGTYFEKFGGTFLNDAFQPCTHLGGGIQIANTLLGAIDTLSFEKNDNGMSDGMVGYMIQRTPIGKMHPNDNRNFWTFVIDSENFAGPLMYSSAYFWEHPHSWHPDVKTWADPTVKIGYTAFGVEGEVGTVAVQKDGFYYFRFQDTQFALDQSGDSFTFASGHSEYYNDWARDVLEPILDGTRNNPSPSDVLQASNAARTKPACIAREPEANFFGDYNGEFLLSRDDDDSPFGRITVTGWGIGNSPEMDSGMETAWCRNRLPVDTSNPKLSCDGRRCRLSPYFRVPVEEVDGIRAGEALAENEVPADVKETLDARIGQWDEVSRRNDGRYLDGPAQSQDQRACFEEPGPADDTLYCRRTSDERWLGYRWYRFVDQPEMNQVMASLPEDEQLEAKCYMQARITRLHEMQSKQRVPRWYDAPADLPVGKAKIDEGFLVQPPRGFEAGYVPIVVYSKVREKPANCVVDKGPHNQEPDPLPPNYYSNPQEGLGFDLDPEACQGTEESGGDYDPTNTVFVSARDGSGRVRPYKVPNRGEVSATLPKPYDVEQCSNNGGQQPTSPIPVIPPNTPNPPSPTPATTPSPEPSPLCLSGSALVEIEEGKLTSMDNIKIGDRIRTGASSFEPVYSFGHYSPAVMATFLRIVTSSQHRMDISMEHLVFLRSGRVLPAGSLRAGDELLMVNDDIGRIESIHPITAQGAYAPLTPSGHLVVNNVTVSSYAAVNGSASLTIFPGIVSVSLHWLTHTVEFPHRLLCHHWGSCPNESYATNGILSWLEVARKLLDFVLRQNVFLRTILLLALALGATGLALAETLFWHPVVALLLLTYVYRTAVAVRSNKDI